MNIFLCHSKNDKEITRNLYNTLVGQGYSPWFDEKNLLPGQDWDFEIKNAIKTSTLVLVLLSNNSINKLGYVQKEIKLVLNVADEHPEGSIFLIPVKIEQCEVPCCLNRWQYAELYDGGMEKLLCSLHIHPKNVNNKVLKEDVNISGLWSYSSGEGIGEIVLAQDGIFISGRVDEIGEAKSWVISGKITGNIFFYKLRSTGMNLVTGLVTLTGDKMTGPWVREDEGSGILVMIKLK